MRILATVGFLTILAGLALAWGGETYTVKVTQGQQVLETFTNCIYAGRCPDSKDGTCRLIRHIQNGRTNDFHAWLVDVWIATNAPAKGAK